MTVSSGFFDSKNRDRLYNAKQLSSIFDGVIVDGVFASIGTAFVVKANSGNKVNVGVGKAWFNHSWIINDTILPLTLEPAELLLNRYDAIVLDMDSTISVRANSIKILKGTPATNPSKPVMLNEEYHHQYPLCYIYRGKGTTEIVQANIENCVGTPTTPFVTGILQTISLDDLLGQWQDDLNRFRDSQKNLFNQEIGDFIDENTTSFNQWYTTQTSNYEAWFEQMKTDLANEQALLDQWVDSEQADFLQWYNRMKGQLDTDPAGHLQLSIDNEELKRILLCGFVDCSKTISADGRVITSTSTDGRILTKTFNDDFSVMTLVLKSSVGADMAKIVKTFSGDGLDIITELTYY